MNSPAPAFLTEFEALAEDVATFRKRRSHLRAPFPIELLQRAVELAKRSPSSRVFSKLKLDEEKVQNRIRVVAPKKNVRKRARKAVSSRSGRSPFVEVPVVGDSTPRVVSITVDRGDGVRLTFEVPAGRTREAISIALNFVGE